MNYDILDILLKIESTVPIGSMPLGVATENSDLDLCVLKSDIPETIVNQMTPQNNSKYKYDASFLLQYSTLYILPNIDIFVFEDHNKLAIIHKVMYIMENYPKFVLRIKWVRVKMFRYLLEKEGFLDEQPMGPFTNSSTKDV